MAERALTLHDTGAGDIYGSDVGGWQALHNATGPAQNRRVRRSPITGFYYVTDRSAGSPIVSAQRELYTVSEDGGNTWEERSVASGFRVSAITPSPVLAGRLWAVGVAASPPRVRVYRTDNSGGAWDLLLEAQNEPQGVNGWPFDQPGDWLTGDLTTPDGQHLLFVAYSHNGVGNFVWISQDGGDSWTPVDALGMSTFGNSGVFDKDDTERVFWAGAGTVRRSTDGGSTWSTFQTGLAHTNIVPFIQVPSGVLLMGGGGSASTIWRGDGEDPFSELPFLDAVPENVRRKGGDGLVMGGDGAIYVLTLTATGSKQHVYRSQDAGDTWEQLPDTEVLTTELDITGVYSWEEIPQPPRNSLSYLAMTRQGGRVLVP